MNPTKNRLQYVDSPSLLLLLLLWLLLLVLLLVGIAV
jgi:hypothetical protein